MKDNANPLTQLFRVTCPSPLELQLFYFHELDGARQGEVAGHIERCPHCKADVASLAAFLSEDDTGAYERLPERVRAATTALTVTFARLIPAGPTPAAAYRGDASQMQLFDADDLSIALQVERTAGARRFQLAGQVLADNPDEPLSGTLTVTPRQPAAQARGAALRAAGSFEVSDLDAGVYRMVISLSSRRIVIPGIVVGSPASASE